MTTKKLRLRSQADRRLKKGHLWFYANEVDTRVSPMTDFEPGEVVTVIAAGGKVLGTAFVNPNALLCGRLVSRDERPLDEALIAARLTEALAVRAKLFAEPWYRLCYGDSDRLPGLVIDRFGEVAVVQVTTAGFDRLMDEVLAALEQVLAPKGIVVRNDHGARELEGLEAELSVVGEVPAMLEVRENGARFEIPATGGQKTGWFFDHRDNRAFLQQCVAGARVLDVFAYVGGWGVEAAVAGAAEVTCVDASKAATELVAHNAALNGVAEKVTGLCGKAVDILKEFVGAGREFDVVVLDPPAFIKKRKDQKAGEAAYRHINELALRLLAPGGLLVSASCSMPLQRQTLIDIVQAAAHHQHRHARLVHTGSQSACHPIHPAIAETEYLKALFFCV